MSLLFTSRFRLLVGLILIVVIAVFFMFSRREKEILGTVVDCNTRQPIKGAEISVNQRGWGFSGNGVVWDKSYISSAVTDEKGHFSLRFNTGSSAYISAAKAGYLRAEQYEYPSSNVEVGLLASQDGRPNETTIRCKLSSDCLSCSEENGVRICKDSCQLGS